MKSITACLLAAVLLLALPQATHADQFSQIQNSPNTYWVPPPANQGQTQGQPAYPQPGYATAPPSGYYPPPGYVASMPPPPGYYYGPRPYYYGPPPIAAGYYGGPHGSRVVIGIPGLFFAFHIH